MWIWQGNVICDYDCCCYCYCQINYDIAALALRGKKKEGNERECMIIMRGKRESTHSAPPAWAAVRLYASVPYARSPSSPDSLVYVIW